MPIEVVSKLLGHVNLSTTVVYTQVSTARMLEAYKKGASSRPAGTLSGRLPPSG